MHSVAQWQRRAQFRSDRERLYNHLNFYFYDDLLVQMKRYMRRSDYISIKILDWKSLITKQRELEAAAECSPEIVAVLKIFGNFGLHR